MCLILPFNTCPGPSPFQICQDISILIFNVCKVDRWIYKMLTHGINRYRWLESLSGTPGIMSLCKSPEMRNFSLRVTHSEGEDPATETLLTVLLPLGKAMEQPGDAQCACVPHLSHALSSSVMLRDSLKVVQGCPASSLAHELTFHQCLPAVGFRCTRISFAWQLVSTYLRYNILGFWL